MQIEHGNLEKGKHVWYDYENSTYPASGPFEIVGFFQDHEGRHVQLYSMNLGERNVCLAADDDYGQPIFYNAKPK